MVLGQEMPESLDCHDGGPTGPRKPVRWPAIGIATVLMCTLAIVPLLLVDFPPLVDIFGHLGRFAIQTEFEKRPELQTFYSYEWKLIGNLGVDLLVEVTKNLFGLQESVRFAVFLIQIIATAGIMLLYVAIHGRISPFAVIAVPLVYNFPFNFGFLNFSLSMALALLALALWLVLRRNRTPWAARIWLLLAALVIWVCHSFGWAFFGLLAVSTCVAELLGTRRFSWAEARKACFDLLPMTVPIIPMLAWRIDAGWVYTGGWSISSKLNWIISIFRNGSMEIDLLSVTILICLCYWAIRSGSILFDKRLKIAAVLGGVCFLALPMYVMGSAYADMRLAPYVLLITLVGFSPAADAVQARRALWFVAIAFFVGRTAATGFAYAAHERIVEAHLPAVDAIPKGSRVAFFVVRSCAAQWPLPVLDHLGSLALARRSVFVNDQWYGPGFNPLVVHHKAAEPFVHDPSQIVTTDGCGAEYGRPLSDVLKALPYKAFTHVLIVGSAQPMPASARLKPVVHAGKGWLFEISARN